MSIIFLRILLYINTFINILNKQTCNARSQPQECIAFIFNISTRKTEDCSPFIARNNELWASVKIADELNKIWRSSDVMEINLIFLQPAHFAMLLLPHNLDFIYSPSPRLPRVNDTASKKSQVDFKGRSHITLGN